MSDGELTFELWKNQQTVFGLRRGQQLFNTAPAHISSFVVGVMHLDPFHVNTPQKLYVLENFLKFAELVWDTKDQQEMEEAARMVLDEKGARGHGAMD